MNFFKNKNISPMLLKKASEPFDSKDHIFELKFDGARCIAYLDKDKTVLKNKRNKDITDIFPELKNLHNYVKAPCILDGEIFVMNKGKPDFNSYQKRALTTNEFKIKLKSDRLPASFVCFDIIQLQDHILIDEPLVNRKEIIKKNIIETPFFSYSRYIEKEGKRFFELAKKEKLEGIVAKKKDGKYHFGKRSVEWLKIKVMTTDVFLLLGYIKEKDIRYLYGKYEQNILKFYGTIYGGTSHEKKKF